MQVENRLHYNTTSSSLLNVLSLLMTRPEFNEFRLVGGTALSLQIGHRMSVDLDLFSDAPYGSLNFESIDAFLRIQYPYVDTSAFKEVGMGRSYFIGNNKNDCVKLDLYYTDKFIDDFKWMDSIRLASIEEIIAMKFDIISRGGRKKDYWDIHELLEDYSFSQMLAIHEKRYPYSHDSELIKTKFNDFSSADVDFDPICMRGKHWELIKLDILEFVAISW